MFARLMGLKTISPEALHRLMQSEPVTTIDVNSRQSWLSARVPGARHVAPDVTGVVVPQAATPWGRPDHASDVRPRSSVASVARSSRRSPAS